MVYREAFGVILTSSLTMITVISRYSCSHSSGMTGLPGVAWRVGLSTAIPRVVVCTHFHNHHNHNSNIQHEKSVTDHVTGIELDLMAVSDSSDVQPAAVLTLRMTPVPDLPAFRVTTMRMSYTFDVDINMHVMVERAHQHASGLTVRAMIVGGNGTTTTSLGTISTGGQPAASNYDRYDLMIRKIDRLLVECTFNNTGSHTIAIG